MKKSDHPDYIDIDLLQKELRCINLYQKIEENESESYSIFELSKMYEDKYRSFLRLEFVYGIKP